VIPKIKGQTVLRGVRTGATFFAARGIDATEFLGLSPLFSKLHADLRQNVVD